MSSPTEPERSAPPPPPVDRRMGWTTLPPRCPRCDRVLRDGNLMPVVAPRCERCHTMLYMLVHLASGLAYLAETNARELYWLNHQQMTPAEVLAHFGALFG